jgi:hypothetical protein
MQGIVPAIIISTLSVEDMNGATVVLCLWEASWLLLAPVLSRIPAIYSRVPGGTIDHIYI